PLHEDVVDAVVDEVATDRVVHLRALRHLELRSDAVRARDEDRVPAADLGRVEEAPEEPDIADDAGGERLPDRLRRALDGLVLARDVDPGIAVAFGGARHAPRRIPGAGPCFTRE